MTAYTLRAHRREMFARFEIALAAVLAKEPGATPNAIEPFIAAVAIVAIFRARFELPPESRTPQAIQTELRLRARRAFTLLADGLTSYAIA